MRTRRYGSGHSPRRIYLVAPRTPPNYWSMEGTARLFGAQSLMPPAALATLMALTPDDVDVEYTLCDENVDPVVFDGRYDLVALTGSTLHARRIAELARRFSARGVPVAIGGTYASIRPEACRELCDHLFVGEAEHTWPKFLHDLCAGHPARLYEQPEPVDLAQSPAPHWSLIDTSRYIEVPVQTTRGCPHGCEFCDVIQVFGRRCRTKTVDQVLAEVQGAADHGAHSIFFSDDNFLCKRPFTRELVEALVAWNTRRAHPLSFSTQITLDVGDDEALLRRLADARFSVLFLGVETVRPQSLAEVNKRHNLGGDPVARVRAISRYGLVPFVGLVVGFDHDDATVFEELEHFVEQTSTPIIGISLLNAPRNTPLYARLARAGRLVGEDFSGEWQLGTNIVPLQMSREELERGYWRLFTRLYRPARFEARLRRWLAMVDYRCELYTRRKADLSQFKHIGSMGRYLALGAHPEVRQMFLRTITWGWRNHRRQMRRIFTFLGQYKHFHDFIQQVERRASGR